MESYTDQDLLAELLAANPPPAERHGGITVTEYAEARNISRRQALTALEALRNNKKTLCREWSLVDGRGMYVYYRVG